MIKDKFIICGNSGDKVRSDCEISLRFKSSGGIKLELESRVESMYGASIRELIKSITAFFDISDAEIEIKDSGALPFVLMARMEAAIKSLTETDKEYLPDMIPENLYSSQADRYRFSRLYLPGNTPSMMLNAGLHAPDGVILDLEDSVSPAKKHEARFLVRNALRQVNFYGAERMVRINQGEMGIGDLDYIVAHNVNLILAPKCESAEYLRSLNERIDELKTINKINSDIFLMPIIESALGIERAFDIASAADNVVALAIGLEDYTADLGVQRTNEGNESVYARTRLVNAAKAAGVQPIDSVFSDVSDMEALSDTVKRSKAMGFEGMGCIHPRQISVIKKSFAPETEEIEKALKIEEAFREAENKGLGVVSVGSKMIDPPVVERAVKVINLARELKLIK